ncbi:hypothetical protein [Bacteriophage Phobos]|uniref:Uncharacterized protein n=1 Tax=Bacteriophage Phobos TaxID=2662138 RepID=A0A5Q2U6V0_9CAUD|nr:hypothetical protein JT319_gp06 [Bacteriophage Phobos]QGH44975.1 hypothetical protein [Bacteriophage Phobos]WPK42371.1 hypothetical protein [Pseudomonas phage Ppu-503]
MFLPDALLADCDVPVWTGGDFAEAGRLAVLRREALLACNLRLTEARRLQEQARKAAAPY